MSVGDFRMAIGVKDAQRCAPMFSSRRQGATAAARNGLRYERKVGHGLDALVTSGHFLKVEHNPWFQFVDLYGTATCSPDFLLHTPAGLVIVEVKLTWVETAIHKLNDLYTPVISFALACPTRPLIICRNLTPAAPSATHGLRDALASPQCLLHWPEIGSLL